MSTFLLFIRYKKIKFRLDKHRKIIKIVITLYITIGCQDISLSLCNAWSLI